MADTINAPYLKQMSVLTNKQVVKIKGLQTNTFEASHLCVCPRYHTTVAWYNTLPSRYNTFAAWYSWFSDLANAKKS